MRPILTLCLLFLVACGGPEPAATRWPTPTPLPRTTPEPTPVPIPNLYATWAPTWAAEAAAARTPAASRATALPASSRATAVLLPISAYACPATHVIKGNRNSMIYHMPGQEYYTRTKPEWCFALEADAIMAGYRKALR